MVVWDIFQPSPPFFSNAVNGQCWTVSRAQHFGAALHTFIAMPMCMKLKLEWISTPCLPLVSNCQAMVSCFLFKDFIFRRDIYFLEFHGFDFLRHCGLLKWDRLNIPFGLFQSSFRVVLCGRQVTSLGKDNFQPLRRKLNKKGTLPCLKGWSTKLSASSTGRCKFCSEPCIFQIISGSPPFWARAFSRTSAPEKSNLVHDPWIEKRLGVLAVGTEVPWRKVNN